MGLNFGDVALNLAAGAIDKDEKYRQEALEQRYKELADNKELYRALATTRYSKDLDKYYKETEKYDALKSAYKEIQDKNLSKREAAMKLIGATPEYAFQYQNAKDETVQENLIQTVMAGFKDKTRTETVGGGAGSPETTKEVADGFTFTHSGLNIQAPDPEDYFQDPNYWGKLAKEIESGTVGPLSKQIYKLMGKQPAEVDLDQLEQKAGTIIREDIDPIPYSSGNTDADIPGMITNPDNSAFANDSKALSVLNTKYQTYAGEAQTGNKASILNGIAVLGDGVKDMVAKKEGDDWVITDEGTVLFNQSRQIYNQVVNDLYFNVVKANGRYAGRDDLFTDEIIQSMYLNEVRRRTFTLNNKNVFGAIGLDTGDIKGTFMIPTSVLPINTALPSGVKDGLQAHLNEVFADSEGNLFQLYPQLIAESKAYLNSEGITTKDTDDVTGGTGEKIASETTIIDLWKNNRNKSQKEIIEMLESLGWEVPDELKNKEITLAPSDSNEVIENEDTVPDELIGGDNPNKINKKENENKKSTSSGVGDKPWLFSDGTFNSNYDPGKNYENLDGGPYTVGTEANEYLKAKNKYERDERKKKSWW